MGSKPSCLPKMAKGDIEEAVPTDMKSVKLVKRNSISKEMRSLKAEVRIFVSK